MYREAKGDVSLPPSAPSAQENLFFDIVPVAPEMTINCIESMTIRLYYKYGKYDKIVGQNRHSCQLSPTGRHGYV